MMALPDADDKRTLLGIEFLKEARIILNISQRAWFFADKPSKWINYSFADTDIQNKLPHLLKTKPAAHSLKTTP